MEFIVERFNYWVVIVLMMGGLYIVLDSANMIKRLVGLSIFQTSIFLFYISLSKVSGGTAPILVAADKKKAGYGEKSGYNGEAASKPLYETGSQDMVAHDMSTHMSAGDSVTADSMLSILYSNPLPHVLILTAIVVGVATLAVGLAITIRTYEVYDSIELDTITQLDMETALLEEGET